MTNMIFQSSRDDGRSNAEVIVEYVKDAEPGRIYRYEELAAALSQGASRSYDLVAVRQIVFKANRRLSKAQQRVLENIVHVGYRLAHAKEHCRLAVRHTNKADRQLLRGLDILRNVRWDELDPVQRQITEAHLLVTSAVYEQSKGLERRVRKMEIAVTKLMTQSSNNQLGI